MPITFTGQKYTGTLTSAGTTTLTDSAATFTTSDFAYSIPRMIWLFRSGVPVAIARCILATSGTSLTLDAPFADYDGDEVTQVVGDTYYVSLDHTDVATTGWAVSDKVVTITDQVIYGTAGSYTSLFLHMEDVALRTTGFSVTNPDNALFIGRGGCVSYGNPVDAKGRIVGNRCTLDNVDAVANCGFGCKDLAFSQLHYGTKLINAVNNPGGTGSANFTPGHWQVFMNCEMVNCNLTSPNGGGPWTSRETFQRAINTVSVAGQTNALNLRWSNGYIEGGSFSCPGGGLSPFGADANGTYEIGGSIGERLAVYAAAKNALFRSNVANTYTVNWTNMLVQDAFKNALTGLGPGFNTNATFNFIFQDKYTNLETGSKIHIDDTASTTVFSETVGVSGETSAIDLTYQTRTFPTTSTTSDTFFNPWTGGIYKYGLQAIGISIDAFDDTLAGRSVKNVEFGGPQAQAVDALITEANKATVDAYTSNDTAREAYDGAAALWEDTYAGGTLPIIGRSGDQVIVGTGYQASGLTIDATASSVRDLTGSAYTIKSASFSGGATGGPVTIANGALLTGGEFDQINIDSASDGDTYTGVITPLIVHSGTGTVSLTISGGDVDEIEVTGGADLTVTLAGGSPIPTLTETSGTITLIQEAPIDASGLLDGTQVQLYNVTKDSELSLSTVSGGAGYSTTINLQSASVDAGDIIQIRASHYDATLGYVYDDLTLEFTASANGYSSATTQTECPICSAIHAKGTAYEGANVTGFSLDVANIQIDSSVTAIDGQKLATWLKYQIAKTADGIRNYFGAVLPINLENFRFTKSIQVDNTGLPAIWTGAAWTRTDNVTIVAPTSNTIQFDNALISFPAVSGDRSSVIDAIYTDTQRVDALIEDVGGDRFTAKALEQAASGSGGATAQEVWEYATRTITGGTVDTCTTNTDMRGTDNAFLAINYTPSPTAAQNAAAVWDEAKAGHVVAGSFGEEVQAHALSTEVTAIPKNPVLTTDSRLNHLDAAISSRSTFDPTTEEVTTDAASRDASKANVSALATQASLDTVAGRVRSIYKSTA